MLSARNIHKNYGQLHVLKGVDLDLKQGELVSLVGASGAGKSTLLQILGTLDKPDRGEVSYNGEVITHFKESRQAEFRNKELGFVFQFHHLLPEFNALENVALPGYIQGNARSEVEKRAGDLLKFMNLGDRLLHKPSELSGGEQQRVAVARALINRPRLILADEPTGNLDSMNSGHLFELFFELSGEFDVGFLITTHNEGLATRAHRTLRMKDGLIITPIEA